MPNHWIRTKLAIGGGISLCQHQGDSACINYALCSMRQIQSHKVAFITREQLCKFLLIL